MKNRYIAAALFAVVSLMNCNTMQAKDDFTENYNYKRGLEFWNDDKANAKNWLLREVEATPLNGLAFYRLSALYRFEGDYKKAIDASSQAITLLKKDLDMLPYAYLERALEYCLSADTTKALSDLSVGLKLCPKSGELYEGLGYLSLETSNPFVAKMYLQKATSMLPTSARAYQGLGRLFYSTGELQESLESYNNGLKFAGPAAWTYIGRAETRIKMGSVGDAADDVLEALILEKDNAKAMSLIQQIADISYPLMQAKLKARRLKDSGNAYWTELADKVKAYKEQGAALYDKNASLDVPYKDYMERFVEKPASAVAEQPAAAPKTAIPGATLYKQSLLSKDSPKVDIKEFVKQSAESEFKLSPEHVTPYALSTGWQY